MKMKKIEMSFGQLMELNVKIKKGEVENLVINEELALAIQDRMFAVTRTRNKSVIVTKGLAIMETGVCELSWTINKGWTCMKATGKIMGDILVITRVNGDTNEKTEWFYKIEGYENPQKEEVEVVELIMPDGEKMQVEFKPENTAIDTNQSHTAKMVVENMLDGDKVLDYGCGTGRNMRYIKNNADVKNIVVEGCDIADQLVRNAHKHEELKKNGMDVFEDVNTPKEKYNIVLNSHVLNVIPSDEIKQLVMNNIYDALVDGGHALIEVRTKSDVEGAKYKVPFGDGWHMTKTNTYQESLTKEKMQMLALNAGFTIEEHFCKSTRHYMILQKNTGKVAVA